MLSKFNKKKSYQGYTIIEILLVLVLILIFFSALIFNFISLDKRNNLSDGTLNTQTIFRIVKSQSEISGKTFRIKFIKIIGGDEGDILKEKYKDLDFIVEWEPNPIEYPNVFETFEDLNENCKSVSELVEFVKLQPTNNDIIINNDDIIVNNEEHEITNKKNGTIMFYPDGSSDSAILVVSSKSEEDNDKKIININGVIGSVSIKNYEDSSVHF